jgi:hypothetical protein
VIDKPPCEVVAARPWTRFADPDVSHGSSGTQIAGEPQWNEDLVGGSVAPDADDEQVHLVQRDVEEQSGDAT